MKQNMTTKKKIGFALCTIVIGLIIYAIYYLTTYLPADELAKNYTISTSEVQVIETSDTITFTPTNNVPTTGLIYYPGGKVDPTSFAYAAHNIAKEGYVVIIQKMPFNLAIFGIDKADNIIQNHTEIQDWYISGFSLGGTAASMYTQKHPDQFNGLILYASYTTKQYNIADLSIDVLSLSGTNDGLATPEKINKESTNLPPSTTFRLIEGANHTQMALYNGDHLQSGDTPATISKLEQQQLIIDATVQFMHDNSK